MTQVAVTCIQLIRDLPLCLSQFSEHRLEPMPASIPGQYLEGEDLIEALRGCVGVVAIQFTAFEPPFKWGIIDGIDLNAAKERNISVRNTPDMFDEEVGDVTMAYIVDVARHLTLTIVESEHLGQNQGHHWQGLRSVSLGLAESVGPSLVGPMSQVASSIDQVKRVPTCRSNWCRCR